MGQKLRGDEILFKEGKISSCRCFRCHSVLLNDPCKNRIAEIFFNPGEKFSQPSPLHKLTPLILIPTFGVSAALQRQRGIDYKIFSLIFSKLKLNQRHNLRKSINKNDGILYK